MLGVGRGWVRLAVDLTRRASGFVGEEGSSGEAGRRGEVPLWVRSARLDWRWETEPGVALPEFEAVPERKREMPSAGMEGSLEKFGSGG